MNTADLSNQNHLIAMEGGIACPHNEIHDGF